MNPQFTQKTTQIGTILPELEEPAFAEIIWQNEHLSAILLDALAKPSRLVSGEITAGTPNQLTNISVRFQLAGNIVQVVNPSNINIVHGAVHTRTVYFVNRVTKAIESQSLDLFATRIQNEDLFPLLAIGTYQDTGTTTNTFEYLIAPQSGIEDLNALLYKGSLDCAINPDYPSADAGHIYLASSAGKIGGINGEAVQAGDQIVCQVDASAAGDHATVGANWSVLQGNLQIASTAEATAGTDDTKYMTPLKVNQAAREILGVGHVQMSGRAIAPTGWLLCDGAAVSRLTYADLFAAIGTTFGIGDASTTFNLPNNQGVVPRGAGSQTLNGRLKDGWTIGTVAEDQLQGHYHAQYSSPSGAPGVGPYGKLIADPASNTHLVSPNDGVRDAITDGTNGLPRTGEATRDSSVSYNFYILC